MAVPEQLIVRPCSVDHPDAVELTRQVQEFYRQVYGGTDDSPMTVQEFEPPQGAFLMGYLDEQPAAMGGWRFLPSGTAGAARPAELKRMFVRTGLRGRGYGQLLLGALEGSAAAAGADWMLLTTGQPQLEALRLYDRVGYRDVAPFGHFAGMPQALHLGRRLGEGPSPSPCRATS